MRGLRSIGMGRFTAAGLTAGLLAAVAAAPAGATAAKTPYEANYTSAYGAVHCVGKLVTRAADPGNGKEGGKETEKCTSTEPGGKLTGYFTAGEEYRGYWESDYYATIGEPGVQPTSVLIKVAKNFESFKVVSAIYPVAP